MGVSSSDSILELPSSLLVRLMLPSDFNRPDSLVPQLTLFLVQNLYWNLLISDVRLNRHWDICQHMRRVGYISPQHKYMEYIVPAC